MVTSGKRNMPIVTAWVLRGRAALKTCCPLCPANKSCCGFPTPTERYNCRARWHRAFGPGDPDAAAGLFDTPPLLVRTPPNPDQPARALLAVNPTGADQSTLQRLLDEAFTPPPPLDTWDALEAIGDQAAVLDADGVVIRANCAWRQTQRPPNPQCPAASLALTIPLICA